MAGYGIAGATHIAAVLATLALFVLRGIWMLVDSPMLARKWVRIAPHIVDTVLLLSALYLAIVEWGWPMTPHAWITAKVIALLAYIGLGVVAIKRGPTKTVRGIAFVAALVVFAYILQTALSKTAMPI